MAEDNIEVSQSGLLDANKNRAKFSGHGKARGAAGFLDVNATGGTADYLGRPGDDLCITKPDAGFQTITLAASWDNTKASLLAKVGAAFGIGEAGIDLDLGCLYELTDGQRGCIQSFGDLRGSFDTTPYMVLSDDEQTGDKAGDDEWIRINGAEWPKIKRMLIYIYIYGGASNWAEFTPQVQVRIPGQKPMIVTITNSNENMEICAIAGLENIRDGIRLVNYSEYFPGHAEMDRAFGYGLEWAAGEKE